MADFIVELASSEEDYATAFGWAKEEQWEPGLHDAQHAAHTFPGSLYLGKLNGTPIASLLVVKHEDIGWVGLYIAKPQHRGHGYGLATWKYALEDFRKKHGADVVLGLSGVQSQVHNYEKFGFRSIFLDVRHRQVVGEALRLWIQAHGPTADRTADGSVQVVPLSSIAAEELAAFDHSVVGFRRSQKLLTSWLQLASAGSFSLAAVKDGKVVGYAIARETETGYRFNPLLARTRQVAELLLVNVLSQLPRQDASLYIDIPAANPEANQLAKDLSLAPIFPCMRMLTGGALPGTKDEEIYGIAAWEYSL